MADKSHKLLAEALRKAATNRAGLPLIAGRGQPGLFPPTAVGRAAAESACSEGLFQSCDGNQWMATPRGLDRLMNESDPRELFEDCVRAIEARQDQLEDIRATVNRLHANFDGLRATVERLLPSISRAPRDSNDADRVVQHALGRWQAEASEDCPLPELYRQVELVQSGLTPGLFHDALRRLHAAGRVYLHAWTGPIETMPEPVFALLIGHDVAYYASGRQDAAPQETAAAMAAMR